MPVDMDPADHSAIVRKRAVAVDEDEEPVKGPVEFSKNASLTFSIIVPVLHEAGTIDSFLASLRRIHEYGSCEVIVVDGSLDQETILQISDESVLRLATQAGRGHQMNTGARHAQGSILLFLHADTRLPADALPQIRKAFGDQRFSAGAFRLTIDSNNPGLRLVAQLTTMRSQLTRLPFGDQAIFIRRTVFEQLGGYREIPLMEDLDLMHRLRFTHHRIIILPAAVQTSSRRWRRDGILLGTLRNWILRSLYYLGVPLNLLKLWYQ